MDKKEVRRILREALDCGFWPLEDGEELVIMSCLKLLEDELSEEGRQALAEVERKWKELGDKFWKGPNISRKEERRFVREEFRFNLPRSHWWWEPEE